MPKPLQDDMMEFFRSSEEGAEFCEFLHFEKPSKILNPSE